MKLHLCPDEPEDKAEVSQDHQLLVCLFKSLLEGGKGARGALRLEDTSDSSLAAFF